MKNQYFGDIGDYKKYSLLRTLVGYGNLSIAVCRMRTEDDTSNDGRFTNYLSDPVQWRTYDMEVYDLLRNAVLEKRQRDLRIIENSPLISGITFFSSILSSDASKRQPFFEDLSIHATGTDLIFFDPDNGIEVDSVPYGKKGHQKFIYRHELQNTFSSGHSMLIYQHLPRVARDAYIQKIAINVMDYLSIDLIYSIKVRHAVFFLVPQSHHILTIENSLTRFATIWQEHVYVRQHNNH